MFLMLFLMVALAVTALWAVRALDLYAQAEGRARRAEARCDAADLLLREERRETERQRALRCTAERMLAAHYRNGAEPHLWRLEAPQVDDSPAARMADRTRLAVAAAMVAANAKRAASGGVRLASW